jgi:hypothetical protein
MGPTQPLSSERRHSVVDHRVAHFSSSPPISAERRHSIADTSNIPVIKPTVIRWDMRRHSEQPLFQSTQPYRPNDIAASIKRTMLQESISEEMNRLAFRKDSGVDLEPTRKKLRVMASDQSLARRRGSLEADNGSPIQNLIVTHWFQSLDIDGILTTIITVIKNSGIMASLFHLNYHSPGPTDRHHHRIP